MRKLVTLFLVLAALLTVVTPALAQSAQPDGPRNQPKSKNFELRGQVTAVDTTAGTLKVKVLSGNDAVKDKIGTEITIQTTTSTIISRAGDASTVRLTLANVVVNDLVAVLGVADNGVFTARQIILPAAPRPPRQIPFDLKGQVTAVDTTAGTLTVKVSSGNDAVKDKIGLDVTIQVTTTTIIRHYGDAPAAHITLADVTVGQLVSVEGAIVGDAFIAHVIVTDIPAPQPRQVPFDLKGQVTAVDPTAKTLTVKVSSGNDAVKDKIGLDVTIQVTDTTIIRHYGDAPAARITLADVTVGQLVSVEGAIVGGVFIAHQIVTDVPAPQPRQIPFDLKGQVTVVDVVSNTLTVKVSSGNDAVKDKIGLEITIQVTDTTIIRHFGDAPAARITLAQVTVGQLVSVEGAIVGGAFMAHEIVTDIPAPQPRQTPFNLVGQITAVDTVSSTLTVKVLAGNDILRAKIGTEITLQTDATTVFHAFGRSSRTPITLGDIQVDQYVMVNGRVVDGAYVAKLVIVNVPHARTQP